MANDPAWDQLIGAGAAGGAQPTEGWAALLSSQQKGQDEPVPPTPPVARPWTQDLQQKLDANKKYSGQDYAHDVLSGKLPADQPLAPAEERKPITPDLLKQTAKNAPAAYKKVAQNIEEHPSSSNGGAMMSQEPSNTTNINPHPSDSRPPAEASSSPSKSSKTNTDATT